MLKIILSLGLSLLLITSCKKGDKSAPVQLLSIEISTGEVYTFKYNNSNQLTTILYTPSSVDPATCSSLDPYCNKSSTSFSYTNNELSGSGFTILGTGVTPGDLVTYTIAKTTDSIKANILYTYNGYNKVVSYRGEGVSLEKREFFQDRSQDFVLKFGQDNEGVAFKQFTNGNTVGQELYRLKLSGVKNPFKLSNLNHPVIAEAYTYFIQKLGFNWNVKFAYAFDTMPSEIMYYFSGPKYVFTYQTRADGYPTKATAVNDFESKTVTVTYTYNN
ncbi:MULTISPECIES: hypothetical protein [unclassified Paraflavitalea]|uniref:hypothetical protein n=1 Tax=unclassified Paraflavitalea TaxID=2798305 RepID=UPI003D3468B9